MTWNSLTNLAVNDSVTESHLDQIRENIEHLGGLYAGKELLSALAGGANLQDPDYDSGWFAVTYDTDYTLAHGLGVVPQYIEIWWASSTTPTGSTELGQVDNVFISAPGLVGANVAGVNDTNVYITTGTSSAQGTIASTRVSSGSGAYRARVWK